MARTEIHPISTTLNIAIDYILNPEKTDDQNLCSSYLCTLQCAALDFEDEAALGTGRTTVLAQHIVQSFKPGEITPEQAHNVGRELCDKFLRGQYQYVIATHIDKEHIHNHIIFNNINCESHKSFEYLENRGKNSSEKLRLLSDEICAEHGLSVIRNPERGTSKSYYEWQQDKLGNSWKSKLRRSIDGAVKISKSYEDFLKAMTEQGYECKQGKYLSFRAEGQEKFTRCKRSTLGWYYEKEQIIKRIERYSRFTSRSRSAIIDTSDERIRSSAGLERWAAIRNMQAMSQYINLLTQHSISSFEQLDDKLMQLHEERLKLADKLNDLQDSINEKAELVKLLDAYKTGKPIYAEYKEVRAKEKFRKSHSKEITRYENALRKLKEMFPDNKIPKLENERQKLDEMIQERNSLNSSYKENKSAIESLESAKKTIDDYLENERKSKEMSH